MMLATIIGAGCVGAVLGYLLGYREGDYHARPTWDETETRAARAWHDGVRFGQELERCKSELGL